MTNGQQSKVWHKVETDEDVKMLLSAFGGFHDACLREIYVWTEQFVNEELRMACPSHLDARVRMLFQRQGPDPSAIELLFEQVVGFKLMPAPVNYTGEIFNAWLTRNGDILRWATLPPDEEPDGDNLIWIEGKLLWWRDVSNWMGPMLRYGSDIGLPRKEPA